MVLRRVGILFEAQGTARSASAFGLVSQSLDRVADRAQNASRELDLFVIKSVGQRMVQGGKAAARVFGSFVNEAGKVESSLTRLGFLGEEATAIDQFRTKTEQLTRVLPTSTDEFLRVSTTMRQAGFQIGKVNLQSEALTSTLAKATKSAIALAFVTNQDVRKASDELAQLIKNFKEEDNIENFTSTVAVLGSNMTATAEFIQRAGIRASSFGKAIGLTTPGILAISGQLKSMGVFGRQAGNSLIELFDRLSDPRRFAAIDRFLGQTQGTFKEAFEKDATKALFSLFKAAQDVGSGLDKETKVRDFFSDLNINNNLAEVAFRNLRDGADDMTRVLGLAASQYSETNAEALFLNKALDEQSNTWQGLTAIVSGNVATMAAQFGDILLPTFKSMIQFVDGIVVGLIEWTRQNEGMAQFLLITIGLGSAILFLFGSFVVLSASLGFAALGMANLAASMGITTTGMGIMSITGAILRTTLISLSQAALRVFLAFLKFPFILGKVAIQFALNAFWAAKMWLAVLGPIGLIIAGVVLAIGIFALFNDKVQFVLKGIANLIIMLINLWLKWVNLIIEGVNLINPFRDIPGIPEIPLFDLKKKSDDDSGDDSAAATVANAPALAKGGILTRPTFAHVAEKEPEAVIPLSKLARLMGAGGEMGSSRKAFGEIQTAQQPETHSDLPGLALPNMTIPITLMMKDKVVAEAVAEVSEEDLRDALDAPETATTGIG